MGTLSSLMGGSGGIKSVQRGIYTLPTGVWASNSSFSISIATIGSKASVNLPTNFPMTNYAALNSNNTLSISLTTNSIIFNGYSASGVTWPQFLGNFTSSGAVNLYTIPWEIIEYN